MPDRSSRSPSYRSSRREDRSYDDRRRPRGEENERRRDYHREGPSRRDYDREYTERDRERERDRDRERYTSRSERRRSGSRSRRRSSRSASPTDKNKGKPNFANSGLLAAETNKVKGADGTSTILKYNEPPEARKPQLGWRIYVFKGDDQPDMFHIHRQSAYLLGRDRLVADIPLEHPSCSKQHAVFQHRQVQEKDEYGNVKAVIKPFVIDLESTNGTRVNDEQIPPSRFYELRASDVIKFGLSEREYVLLHDEVS